MRAERVVDVAEPRGRADDGLFRDDAHARELREVDDDAGRRRVAAVAVPARLGDDVDAGLARPLHDLADVLRVERLHDRERVDAVVEAVEDEAGGVVRRLAGREHRAADDLVERLDPRIDGAASGGDRHVAERRHGEHGGQPGRAGDELTAGQLLVRHAEKGRRSTRAAGRSGMLGAVGKQWIVDVHSHVVPTGDDGARTIDDGLKLCRGRREARHARPLRDAARPCEVGSLPADGGAAAALRRGVSGHAGRVQAVRSRAAPRLRGLPGRVACRRRPERLRPGDERRVPGRVPRLLDAGARRARARPPRSRAGRARRGCCRCSRIRSAAPRSPRIPERAAEFVDRGWLLALNGLSLDGRHGPKSQVAAWRLLESGYGDLVASDAHGTNRNARLDWAYELVAVAARCRACAWPVRRQRARACRRQFRRRLIESPAWPVSRQPNSQTRRARLLEHAARRGARPATSSSTTSTSSTSRASTSWRPSGRSRSRRTRRVSWRCSCRSSRSSASRPRRTSSGSSRIRSTRASSIR